jgi:hypothetical protein
MKCGDEEGLGSIYDRNGDLILLPSETIISYEKIKNLTAGEGWNTFGHLMFGGYMGVGILYLTSERIVLIQEPNPMQKIYSHTFAESIPEMYDAAQLRDSGFKEYLNLPLSEVIGYKASRLNSVIRICTYFQNKRYSISISRYDSKILFNFLKTIPAIDKNIEKQYPQKKLDKSKPYCERCYSEIVFYCSGPDGFQIPYGIGKCGTCNYVFKWKKNGGYPVINTLI